ncbi:MAG: agmatine deiminase [Clostridia bacterium]|nr:agmatine deiminase [Clostridia bacterium]
MMRLTTPARDGFYMPGEFEPHEGCVMIWPWRPGSWPWNAAPARRAFTRVAKAIAKSETVYMLARACDEKSAREALPPEVKIRVVESDDAWARDVTPTFVIDGKGGIRGVDWRFNAWGGEWDGLYQDYENDDALAGRFLEIMGIERYDAHPFVMEGGAIHTDGEGTAIVVEACLLSPGRNPDMSREQIESKLKDYLGVERVIWLPHGIYGDETNEHVDNICAFVRPGEVVLAWAEDEKDPQRAYSEACLEVLKNTADAKGRRLRVTLLPVPQKPVTVEADEIAGMVFAPGEPPREAGERLAASYVNFYIANRAVVVPQFGDANDLKALEILAGLFPEREVIPVQARDILLGGGNIHCITQQIPARNLSKKVE